MEANPEAFHHSEVLHHEFEQHSADYNRLPEHSRRRDI
jgi:hypothetical protein